jgi:uncharacterized protein (DUF4415 family)
MSGTKVNGAGTKRSNAKRDSGTGTDWGKVRRRNAAAIHKGISADTDLHVTDAEFWKSAKVVMPAPKEIVTMRLDADLLRWFRQRRGYQTRINAILRAYMQSQE